MQKIIVFQQNKSGQTKIDGIRKFGQGKIEIISYDIDDPLPVVIDDTSEYLPEFIEADLVLDYMTHMDLSEDLSRLCERLGIPLIASGKKVTTGNAVCPPVCCAMSKQSRIGEYGDRFGLPEIDVKTSKGKILKINVKKGAPCGATWLAAEKMKDKPVEEALTRFGLEVQFNCFANPANWDPLWGKSPVHLAADVHTSVLKAALKKEKK